MIDSNENVVLMHLPPSPCPNLVGRGGQMEWSKLGLPVQSLNGEFRPRRTRLRCLGPKIRGHTVIEKLMKWGKNKKKSATRPARTQGFRRMWEERVTKRGRSWDSSYITRGWLASNWTTVKRKGFLCHARMKNEHMAVIGHAKLG